MLEAVCLLASSCQTKPNPFGLYLENWCQRQVHSSKSVLLQLFVCLCFPFCLVSNTTDGATCWWDDVRGAQKGMGIPLWYHRNLEPFDQHRLPSWLHFLTLVGLLSTTLTKEFHFKHDGRVVKNLATLKTY